MTDPQTPEEPPDTHAPEEPPEIEELVARVLLVMLHLYFTQDPQQPQQGG